MRSRATTRHAFLGAALLAACGSVPSAGDDAQARAFQDLEPAWRAYLAHPGVHALEACGCFVPPVVQGYRSVARMAETRWALAAHLRLARIHEDIAADVEAHAEERWRRSGWSPDDLEPPPTYPSFLALDAAVESFEKASALAAKLGLEHDRQGREAVAGLERTRAMDAVLTKRWESREHAGARR